ncbi:MAG: cupin domain-containing protein [Crenarchaeota archaeon]|nr:cupin domain-containing protein [Thermoproteota archaeon]
MRVVHCSGELVVTEARLEEGAVVPRHSHPSVQLTVVLRGRLRLLLEGRGELVLGPGGYVVVPPGVGHEAVALEETVVLDANAPLTEDRRRLLEKLGHHCP